MSRGARGWAWAVAAIAAAGLLLQTALITHSRGSLLAAFSSLSQYFTILSNVLVAVTMAAVGAGFALSARRVGGVLFAIIVVGGIYHLLLARLASPQGAAFVADQLLHTASPLAMVAWWLAFADKASLRWRDALFWLAWPLAYCAYALVRAQFSGLYPYYFINLDQLGWAGLAKSIALLGLGFYGLGLALIALARVLPGRRLRTDPPRR